jgi:hypothetical protein
MATVGEATASMAMGEDAITAEWAASPTVDIQTKEAAQTVGLPISVDSVRMQVIVHRPLRHRAAAL